MCVTGRCGETKTCAVDRQTAMIKTKHIMDKKPEWSNLWWCSIKTSGSMPVDFGQIEMMSRRCSLI